MIIVSATRMKNSFGAYLKMLKKEREIMIEKHGKIIAKIVLVEEDEERLSESLVGILKKDDDDV